MTEFPEVDDRIKKVLKLASELKGRTENLLDIGCGDGINTVLLKEALGASAVYGIDISPGACEAAGQRGVDSICFDIEEGILPFPDEYFDAIFCGEIIEHLFDTDHLLDEIYRLLKPGCSCIITTPNLAAWYNRLSLLLGFQPHLTAASLEHYQAGKLFRGTSGGRDHIRVMTLRAFSNSL